MILYFSATGSCKYVAQRLAAARRTAHFRVEDSCIGCGLCAQVPGAGHPHGKRPPGLGAGGITPAPHRKSLTPQRQAFFISNQAQNPVAVVLSLIHI